MPNSFAYLMLASWPLVSWILFRRLPLERAIICCLLGGYLILPPIAAFDLPFVPAMHKHSIPSVCALVMCYAVAKQPVKLWTSSPYVNVLMLLYILCAIPTVLTNGDSHTVTIVESLEPIRVTTTFSDGLTYRDLGAFVLRRFIDLIPLILGMQFFNTPAAIRDLLVAFIVGGLAYSLLALVEIFMGPNLNIWIYGFLQHDLVQLIRGGGFRPIVFLEHALWVALYMATACIAAISFFRHGPDAWPDRIRYAVYAVYLFGILILCKSLASQLYALTFGALVILTPQRWQFRVAMVLVLIVVTYPMMRNLGLIPVDSILGWAQEFDPDRAGSLRFRLENEDVLMARAHEKPWFGWGGWARNLILDPTTRAVETIPDGRWIIAFGEFGWVGYISEMGLLALPVALLGRNLRDGHTLPPQVVSLVLIVAITMLDMILNATLTALTWLSAGALLGFSEHLRLLPQKKRRHKHLNPVLEGDLPSGGSRTVL